jgi:hypothetical protein
MDWFTEGVSDALVAGFILLAIGAIAGLLYRRSRLKKRLEPDEPQPVRIVPEPDLPQTYPQIRLPEHRNVVGRDKERARLASQLQMGRGAVITSAGAVVQADGGMGKTTLARSYAERTRDRYNGGCWVNAAEAAAMLDDLIAFGHAAFGMAIPSEPGQRAACAKAVVAKAASCGA